MTDSAPAWQAIRLQHEGPVARLRLCRPQIHNAFDACMIEEITAACFQVRQDPQARVLLLEGEGPSFCAGADLRWMRASVEWSAEKNLEDAQSLATMLEALDTLPLPVVARVHGAAMGGGVGLVACADIAVAMRSALLGTTEVRLGLVPAVIGPYVVRKVGLSQARSCFLTGERFTAEAALRMGLVHHVVEEEADLDRAIARVIASLCAGGPCAQAACKEMLRRLETPLPRSGQEEASTRLIARLRSSEEGQEGLRAFLEKRPPAWATRKESSLGPA